MIRSANLSSVFVVLGNNNTFHIPPFQRDYKWTPKQVSALIQDVCSEVFFEKGEFKPYYLGAIVTCPKEKSPNNFDVLDGQQRLTTISIILRSLSRLVKYRYKSDQDLNVSSLLYAGSKNREPKLRLHDPDNKSGDQAVFRDIILTDSEVLDLVEANRTRRGRKGNSAAMRTSVYRAFLEAEEELDSVITSGAQDDQEKVDRATLLADAFKSVNLISIVTESESDAFLLFETLNDRGLDLSAADLIKNKILQNARKGEMILTANTLWKEMSRACDGKTVDFLRAWWNSEKGPFVRKPELYQRYADYIGKPGKSKVNIKKLCESLVSSAEFYGVLLNPELLDRSYGLPGAQINAIRKHLHFLSSLGFVALRPLVMAAMKYRPAIALNVIQFAEMVAVRNLGGNTNTLERAYSAAALLVHPDSKLTDDVVLARVKACFPTALIPDSEKLKSSLMGYSFNVDNSRAILARIDQQMRKECNERKSVAYDSKPPAELHLEHIYPQKPDATCVADSKLTVARASEAGLTWKLGNLTLLESDLNQSASNSVYSVKRDAYMKSEYHMTVKLAKDFTSWGEQRINQRTEVLIAFIDRLWPSA